MKYEICAIFHSIISNDRTSGDKETSTGNMKINVTEYTNSRVAYQKTSKAAFDRYVDLLDTLK